jgi:hypothetical protein
MRHSQNGGCGENDYERMGSGASSECDDSSIRRRDIRHRGHRKDISTPGLPVELTGSSSNAGTCTPGTVSHATKKPDSDDRFACKWARTPEVSVAELEFMEGSDDGQFYTDELAKMVAY